MSDAPMLQFFRPVNGDRRDGLETMPCALLLDPREPLEVATARLTWSSLLANRLREIAKVAGETGKPEGRSLPFASLRAALQVQVPDAVMLAHDLGETWAREDGGAFMHVAEATGGTCATRASGALRTWTGMVLRPWAAGLGLDESLVERSTARPIRAKRLASTPGCLIWRGRSSQAPRSTGFAIRFSRRCRVASPRGAGTLSRPRADPPYCPRSKPGQRGAIPDLAGRRQVRRPGGLYSMVAHLVLESMPFVGKPVLTVRVSRRRWLDRIPDAARLRGQRSLTGYLMGRTGALIAVEFAAAIRSGVPEEPCSP